MKLEYIYAYNAFISEVILSSFSDMNDGCMLEDMKQNKQGGLQTRHLLLASRFPRSENKVGELPYRSRTGRALKKPHARTHAPT